MRGRFGIIIALLALVVFVGHTGSLGVTAQEQQPRPVQPPPPPPPAQPADVASTLAGQRLVNCRLVSRRGTTRLDVTVVRASSPRALAGRQPTGRWVVALVTVTNRGPAEGLVLSVLKLRDDRNREIRPREFTGADAEVEQLLGDLFGGRPASDPIAVGAPVDVAVVFDVAVDAVRLTLLPIDPDCTEPAPPPVGAPAGGPPAAGATPTPAPATAGLPPTPTPTGGVAPAPTVTPTPSTPPAPGAPPTTGAPTAGAPPLAPGTVPGGAPFGIPGGAPFAIPGGLPFALPGDLSALPSGVPGAFPFAIPGASPTLPDGTAVTPTSGPFYLVGQSLVVCKGATQLRFTVVDVQVRPTIADRAAADPTQWVVVIADIENLGPAEDDVRGLVLLRDERGREFGWTQFSDADSYVEDALAAELELVPVSVAVGPGVVGRFALTFAAQTDALFFVMMPNGFNCFS